MAGFAQLLRFAGFRQRQHGFDVHFDGSSYDQVGNGRQLIAVRLLAAGDPLDALKCVVLGGDPPALALRGIATGWVLFRNRSPVHRNHRPKVSRATAILSTAFRLKGAACSFPSPHSIMVLARHGESNRSLCPIGQMVVAESTSSSATCWV